MWTSRRSDQSPVEFNGVPYMGIGRMIMECRYGQERHERQKIQSKSVSGFCFSNFLFIFSVA